MKHRNPGRCSAYQAFLQTRLDGRGDEGLPEPLQAHAQTCPDCLALREAAQLFEDVFPLPAPRPSPDLTPRLITAVLADRRQRQARRRLATVALAVAASVLVLVGARLLWHPVGAGPALARKPNSAPPSGNERARGPARGEQLALRDSLDEARSAVAALTTHTADRTVEPTRMLLPAVASEWAEFPMTSPDWGEPLDPPAQPLGEAGQSVSAGLEPVTSSARRAVSLFFRDLPAGLPVRD
jgi:hypothetical protein